MHGDARIEGYHYCMPLETLLALNYNSFILTVGIIGVDSHARDMYGNSHSQGTCVLLEIPSMHKLVQYSQNLFNNYSPKAKLILLNNPREEVEGIIRQY